MSVIIEDACICGEKINVEIGCEQRVSRTDKKRPFYPDQCLPDGLDPEKYRIDGITVFRCRGCGKPVDETVPSAGFSKG